MKTTREDGGDTTPADLHDELPGGLGKALPHDTEAWRKELADKVAARHKGESSGPAGIVVGPDGKMQTTTHQGGPSKWFKANVYHP